MSEPTALDVPLFCIACDATATDCEALCPFEDSTTATRLELESCLARELFWPPP